VSNQLKLQYAIVIPRAHPGMYVNAANHLYVASSDVAVCLPQRRWSTRAAGDESVRVHRLSTALMDRSDSRGRAVAPNGR